MCWRKVLGNCYRLSVSKQMSIDDSCTYAGRYADKQAKQVYVQHLQKSFFYVEWNG